MYTASIARFCSHTPTAGRWACPYLRVLIAKGVHGLLAASELPAEVVRQAALFGTRNRDGWGVGMTILSALRPDYDARRPHSTLAGRTPDEAYGAREMERLAA